MTTASNSTHGAQLLSTGIISLSANDMVLDTSGTADSQIGGSGTGAGTATNVILSEGTATTQIFVGGTSGTGVQLSQNELNTLRTTSARIGGGSSGLISVGTLAAGTTFIPAAGTGVLTLDSGTGISLPAAGGITIKNLLIRAAGNVDLTTNATTNNITNIADTQSSGSLTVTNASTHPMTVGSLFDDLNSGATVNGITAPGGVTLVASGAGGLLTVNQNISSTNTAISLTGKGYSQASAVTINPGSGTIAVNGGSADINFNSGTLTTSNAAGSAVSIQSGLTVELGNISATAVGATLTLGTAANITGAVIQNGVPTIAANILTGSTNSSVALTNSGNNIVNLSAFTTNGALSVTNSANPLTITGNVSSTNNAIILSAVGITQNASASADTIVNSGTANLTITQVPAS